jgi:hypothetical protein
MHGGKRDGDAGKKLVSPFGQAGRTVLSPPPGITARPESAGADDDEEDWKSMRAAFKNGRVSAVENRRSVSAVDARRSSKPSPQSQEETSGIVQDSVKDVLAPVGGVRSLSLPTPASSTPMALGRASPAGGLGQVAVPVREMHKMQ